MIWTLEQKNMFEMPQWLFSFLSITACPFNEVPDFHEEINSIQTEKDFCLRDSDSSLERKHTSFGRHSAEDEGLSRHKFKIQTPHGCTCNSTCQCSQDDGCTVDWCPVEGQGIFQRRIFIFGAQCAPGISNLHQTFQCWNYFFLLLWCEIKSKSAKLNNHLSTGFPS